MFENIEHDIISLVAKYHSGELGLGESDMEKHLEEDIKGIDFDPDGNVELSTCSELVKTVANSLGARARLEMEPVTPTDTIDLKTYNLELFAKMSDAFSVLTDRPATSFQTLDEFNEEFGKDKYDEKRLRDFNKRVNELFDFYTEMALYRDVEVPLSSGSFTISGPRFFPETFRAVTSMALYADTILIPDPVLPWLERERVEEFGAPAEMLSNLFNVLQLEPLVKADIPGTPIALFPTWSKTQEVYNVVGQWEMNRSVTDFFSHYLGCQFRDMEEVHAFSSEEKSQFRERIEKENLFQPFGGTGDITHLSLDQAVGLQRRYYNENRSEEYAKILARFSDEQIILIGIRERLAPVYALAQQCAEFGSQPMSWLPAQWFFWEKYAKGVGAIEFDEETETTLKALSDPSLQWLANVPIDALANLRREGANSEFRGKMRESIENLDEARRTNSRSAVHQISRTLEEMVAKHQCEINKIIEEYQQKHMQTAVTGWLGLAGMFLPTTAPLVATVYPVGLATKYFKDKSDEKVALKRARGSLLGVLASAARATHQV